MTRTRVNFEKYTDEDLEQVTMLLTGRVPKKGEKVNFKDEQRTYLVESVTIISTFEDKDVLVGGVDAVTIVLYAQ